MIKAGCGVLLLSLALAACGSSDPTLGAQPSEVVGSWTRPLSATPGITVTLLYQFEASGAATVAIRGADLCSGTVNVTNLTWSATGAELTLQGTPRCAGAVVCEADGKSDTIDCTSDELKQNVGTSPYEVANGKLSLGRDTYARE